jgi:sterol 3beta-glucosyltransferase
MIAVVHHGGARATGAGLPAGVPSIITPFVADQPNWAMRVEALGVGPSPIPFKDLTVDRLANAIRQTTSDQTMRKRAADLGARIRTEDGVQTAIDEFLAFARRST